MASATLQTVVDQLQENKKASEDTTTSIKDVADLIRKQLESSRLMAENNKRNRVEASREATRASGGGIGGALGGDGGILGGLGSLVGGIGSGAGMAGLGIGALLAGGGYFLQALENFDGKKVKENVLELFAISEAFNGGMLQFFAEGGLFGAAMTGIGVGLAAFGVGSAAVGLADALNNFFGVEDWAQSVKDNVVTLLSIADEVGGNLSFFVEGSIFGLAMTGLGLGLAVFGAGSAINGLSELITKDGWAAKIKSDVLTLMSIADDLGGAGAFVGDSAVFLLAMTGIATGLALFGAGSTINGLAELITRDDWAAKIKSDVMTLMSIEDDLGGKAAIFGETGTFLAAMTGIAAGLAVFGAGSGIVGLSELISRDDWATKIQSDVLALLSIADSLPGDDTFIGESGKFFLAMSGIAAGLAAFAGGQFVGTMANAVTSVLSFFTGAENPFDQLMTLADNADELILGATALEKITAALNTFAGITISSIDLDFKQLAKDLGEAVPFLSALANGGPVEGSAGWITGPITFPEGGILNPNLKLDEMAAAIAKVNYVLGQTTTYPVNAQAIPSTSGADLTAANTAAQAAIYNAPVYNNVTNNYNGGGGTSIMTVPVATGDSLDRRDGIRRGR